MIPSFAKIYTIGTPEVANLFDGYVEITEKIDGSQLCWGRTGLGVFVIRSKGTVIYQDGAFVRPADKLFKAAVDYLISIEDKILPNTYFYGECVSTNKHNTLTYGSVPRNNIVLYAAKTELGWLDDHEILQKVADSMGLDAVELLYAGEVKSFDDLKEFLNRDSYYGGTKIEGFVVKNFHQESCGYSKECFGKFVSESFKEHNGANWAKTKKDNSIIGFLDSFKNEVRWNKALTHMKEDGQYTGTLKDIATIIGRVHDDVLKEDEGMIKEKLYVLFIRQIKGASVRGLPEWFKEVLAKEAFPNVEVAVTTGIES